jgi:hypothetical protein
MEFSCSEDEFRGMREFFFSEGGKSKELDEDALTLVLVVLGVKPGGAFYRNLEKKGFEQALRDAGIYFRTPPAKIRDEGIDNRGGWEYLIARDRGRLDIMDENYGSRKDFDRDLGVFCGFPEEDVEWFIDHGKGEWPEWRKGELAEISAFAFYRPKPEEGNIQEARKRVERNRKALRKMDESFGIDLGERLLESLERLVEVRNR